MKTKIAFLEEGANIGGAEVNALYLIERLDKEKIETIVICPCEGPLTDRIMEIGGKVAILPRLPMFSTSSFIFGKKITNPFAAFFNLIMFIPTSLNLSRYLKSAKIDVLHTNSMLAHFYGGIACRLAGVKCLWHLEDIVDSKQASGIFLKAINWSGLRLADRIVVCSHAVSKSFNKKVRSKVRVIHNATDLSKFSSADSGKKIRKELGIKPGEAVVGLIGRIVHWKGQNVLLQAAENILKKFPNTRFLIVGDTSFGKKEYLDKLKKQVLEAGIEQAVIFTGFRQDIPEIFTAIDISVNPSTLPEPFGISIIEAMAAKKAVVATNGGGIPEIVVDGVTGKLVPMKDVEALQNVIVDLLKDPQKREKMGQAGRERVEKYFSIDIFVESMSNNYRDLAHNM